MSVCVHTCVSVCAKSLVCYPLCDGAAMAQVDIVLSCMGKRVACCVFWTHTSVGQTGFDRRHHKQK